MMPNFLSLLIILGQISEKDNIIFTKEKSIDYQLEGKIAFHSCYNIVVSQEY